MRFNSFVRRDGARWRFHTILWLAWSWRQCDEGWSVVDDFGTLVVVER